MNDTDTLEKVALRFNSTPSVLIQLNKLNTRVLFPGQVCFICFNYISYSLQSVQILFVPEKCTSYSFKQQSLTSDNLTRTITPLSVPKNEDEGVFVLRDHNLSDKTSHPSHFLLQQDIGPIVWSITRGKTAIPGYAHRIETNPSTDNELLSRTIDECLKQKHDDTSKQVNILQRSLFVDENQQLDHECLQRFIKLNVRLMTENRVSIFIFYDSKLVFKEILIDILNHCLSRLSF